MAGRVTSVEFRLSPRRCPLPADKARAGLQRHANRRPRDRGECKRSPDAGNSGAENPVFDGVIRAVEGGPCRQRATVVGGRAFAHYGQARDARQAGATSWSSGTVIEEDTRRIAKAFRRRGREVSAEVTRTGQSDGTEMETLEGKSTTRRQGDARQ